MIITVAFLAFIGIPMLLLVLSVTRTVFGFTSAPDPQPRTVAASVAAKRPVTPIDASVAAPAPSPVPDSLVQAARVAGPLPAAPRPPLRGEVVAFPRRPIQPAGEQRSHAG